jgi:hypothetical protein
MSISRVRKWQITWPNWELIDRSQTGTSLQHPHGSYQERVDGLNKQRSTGIPYMDENRQRHSLIQVPSANEMWVMLNGNQL